MKRDKMNTENRGVKQELFDFLCQQWLKSPVLRTMEMSLLYLGPGTAGLKMVASHDYSSVRGRLHGGIIASLTDTAMGWAILGTGHNCMTVDMYMNYFAPVFDESELIANARVLHLGKRTAVAEAFVVNEKGDNVAAGRGAFSLQRRILQEFGE